MKEVMGERDVRGRGFPLGENKITKPLQLVGQNVFRGVGDAQGSFCGGGGCQGFFSSLKRGGAPKATVLNKFAKETCNEKQVGDPGDREPDFIFAGYSYKRMASQEEVGRGDTKCDWGGN